MQQSLLDQLGMYAGSPRLSREKGESNPRMVNKSAEHEFCAGSREVNRADGSRRWLAGREISVTGSKFRRPQQSRLTLTVAEPAGGLLGVVGEDYGGAGALDAGQDFEDYALFVEPAFGR